MFCTSPDPVQALVSERQAVAVKEAALAGAILCTNCGCVYVRDPRGNAHTLGTLRQAGSVYSWKSNYKAPGAA